MDLAERRLLPYRLPLRTPFRGLTQRRGALISGTAGWGEFAPFDDYGPDADARWLACALEQADGCWPDVVRDEVEVNAIIPAVAPDVAARMAVETTCRTIKIKIGDPDGFRRVVAVREARPDAALRVDVNGAWTVEQAEAGLAALSPLDLQYAEQPVRTFGEMAELRRRVDVPLAADELIRADGRLDVREVADVAILKVPTLGGVAATVRVAEQVGLPVVISSALDSSLGLAAGLAAACALPDRPLACGLGTGVLFARDTCVPLLPESSGMRYRGYPQPDPEMPVAHEDLGYWRDRLAVAAGRGRGTVVG